MNDDGSNVVGMGFEGGNFLRGIVVVDSELEVIAPTDYPIFPSDESTSADRNVGKLERLNDRLLLFSEPTETKYYEPCLCLVRPYVYMACERTLVVARRYDHVVARAHRCRELLESV